MYKNMDYTYLLELESVKNMRRNINIDEDGEILIILCYHITDTCKQPFLQFLFTKTMQNVIFTEQFSLPYLYVSKSSYQADIMEQTIDYVKNALLQMSCNVANLNEQNYKGITYLSDNFPVALVNVSNIDINYMKLYRNSEYWFLLPTEVINNRSVCNIKVEESTVDMFIKYASSIALLQNPENNILYSLPDAVYCGRELEEAKFNSIFGERKRYIDNDNYNKNDKYYIFYLKFNDAVLEGGWIKEGGIKKIDLHDKNITHNLSGRLLVENEYGKYVNNGINRYALFVDFATTNDDITDDEIKYIKIDNKQIVITKDYENFTPLTYHSLNKELLGDKYEPNSKNYMII
jgi:hypothetical protein